MTDAEFRAWCSRDNEDRCVLVELDYVDEVTDSPAGPVIRTLYLSDRVFFDTVTHNAYIDVVRSAPQYTRSLSGDQLGRYTSSIGTLELDNADGALDFLLNLACDGSAIRFYFGGRQWPVADFKHIFSAIVSKCSAPSPDRISVALKDTGLLLDKSIGGESVVGGSGPNADRSRPANFGTIHNEAPLFIETGGAGGKYAHSDDGTDTAATEVRDRGVSVAFTDNADGTFDLTAPPDGAVTCDVLAEPLGDGNVLVSDAVDHLIGTRAGLSALSLYDGAGPTFTPGDEDDYQVGVSLPEARNVIDLLDDLVVKTGNAFWAIKRTGAFTFGRLRLNDIASLINDSPALIDERVIVEDDIVPRTAFSVENATPQYYKLQAYMSRNWTRQTDFATSLSPDDQAVFTRPGLYLMQPDGLGTTYEDRPELYHKTLAISPVIDTLISAEFSPTDLDILAQWMTTRRAMLLPWVNIASLTVWVDFFELELGDPVRLIISRFGADDGVLFQVISITIRLTEARVELKLARRNIIQAVPDAWLRLVSAPDTSQPDYTPAPPTIAPIDVSTNAIVGGGADGGSGAETAKAYIGPTGQFRIRYVRPRLIVPPLHADVLLYVTMLGGDYTDHSSYAATTTVAATDFVANGDLFECYHTTVNDSGVQKVRYTGAQFNHTSSDDFTIEGFVKWVASDNNAAPWVIFQWETTPPNTDSRKFMPHSNAGQAKYDDSGFGTEAGPVNAFTTNVLHHWAWVHDGTADTHEFYIDGVLIMTETANGVGNYSSDVAWVEIGGAWDTGGSGPTRNLHIFIGETRMVRRKLYTGNFTPPAPYNLSVIS